MIRLFGTAARATVLAATAGALLLAGCGKAETGDGRGGTLTLWTHNAGNKAELGVVQQIVKDYNASQTKYKVKVQAFPQDSYNQSVAAAAAARSCPASWTSTARTCPTGPGPATWPR